MALLLQETPQPFTEREERPIFQPLPVNRGKFFMKLGLPIAVLGIALGALRQTSVQTILPAATGTEQALAVLAACGALVLVLVTLLALQSASGWNRLFRPLVPFVAVVVFLFPVGGVRRLGHLEPGAARRVHELRGHAVDLLRRAFAAVPSLAPCSCSAPAAAFRPSPRSSDR